MLTATVQEILVAKGIGYHQMQLVGVEYPFLPRGSWPKEEREEDSESTPPSSSEETIDLERFKFLYGFRPYLRINLEGRIGNGYEAFMVRTRSGRKVALVENPVTSNALYVFDGDMEDWQELAQLSKWEVINSGRPEFVKRFFHNETFESRLREFLSTH